MVRKELGPCFWAQGGGAEGPWILRNMGGRKESSDEALFLTLGIRGGNPG